MLQVPKIETISEEDFKKLVPKIFTIETALACNLKCPECAIGGNMIGRAKNLMRFDKFKIIVDKVKPYCEYMYLHLWGEPTLNKNIFEMIEYVSDFTKTNISTNALLLDREKSEQLIASGVTDLIVSIDGFTQDIYEKYRVGGDVQKALTVLSWLQEFNLKYGGKVQISPQFIVFEHNQHEMEQFKTLCNTIGLEPSFKAPYVRTEDSFFKNSSHESLIRPQYETVTALKSAMKDCANPREVFTMLSDGSVVICCHDFDKVTYFGNIFEKDVLEIWNSPEYYQYRWDIVSGSAPSFCLEGCMSYVPDVGCQKEIVNLKKKAESDNNDSVVVKIGEAPVAKECSSGCGSKETSIQDVVQIQQKPWSNKLKRREAYRVDLQSIDPDSALALARSNIASENYLEGIDLYEQLAESFPDQSIAILAELYDQYKNLKNNKNRYSLYVARDYDFQIKQGEKVLDIGSGHDPFPMATHLADFAPEDNDYGRAGVPLKNSHNLPFTACNVEDMPFEDNEFDFVYCSHVLEHTVAPEKACQELQRIAKRGYIETPSPGKDFWMSSAKISNHFWSVTSFENKLLFSEYTEEQTEGLGNNIVMDMHCSPQTDREKALSALIWLKSRVINTHLYWEGSFECQVRRNIDSTTRV